MVRLCSESSRPYFPIRNRDNPSLPATARAAVSNGRRAGTGVSRGHSTESHEPATKKTDGLTTREGLNRAGRHDHRWSCPGALKPTGRAAGSDHRGRERVLLNPQGLSGTAVRGPACSVVWEPGGATLRATRFGIILRPHHPLCVVQGTVDDYSRARKGESVARQ
jgi:hypothetical protein